MPPRTPAQVEFDAITIEGGLLPADWLGRVATLSAAAQGPADYGVPRGLQLRDEIGRYWRIAQALWGDFVPARELPDEAGAAVTRRFVGDLLTQVFGFSDLIVAGQREAGERSFAIALEAWEGCVPVVTGVAGEGLDQVVPRHGDGARRRSAFGALQEYLNATDAALWGIASNGLTLRIGRDNSTLTRPAWIEADLERVFTEERFADFSVLWLVLHASRFGRAGRQPSDCPLEAWRAEGHAEGSRARDALRTGVEVALLELGQGFVTHPENRLLRERLASGDLTASEYFNELLRLVYRMIFLLTIEERGILHPHGTPSEAARLYAEGYGLRRLRERAVRRSHYDRHADLWGSLRPVFRGLGRAIGEPALGLPGLGGLFAEDQCPHLDPAQIENRRMLAAVFHLGWLRQDGALIRVNWKDMGPEELGSVYESLLELVPVLGAGGRDFQFATAGEDAGNARKLTGSYYTPDVLVQQLLDTALEPVVAARVAAMPDQPHEAILSLTVIDPACGSGHFLLAAARRLATHLARHRAGGTPGAEEYRHALRDVVTHCIYGVDRNPMALELARMALWLEAYTPDRALGFFDHHLACGDALLGLLDLSVLKKGIPAEAFKALTGDDREAARTLAARNRSGLRALQESRMGQESLDFGTTELARAFATLESLDDTAVDDAEAKRESYVALHAKTDASRLALAADLFLAAFLSPKREGQEAIVPTSAALVQLLEGSGRLAPGLIDAARATCDRARVLHWPLAFPAVFARGGFDVVLGNPPWERIKLQEQEFFAVRSPAIAQAPNKAARERLIRNLADAPVGSPEAALYRDFVAAKHGAEAASAFCHAEARYPLTGTGDVNTYALFAETMLRSVAPTGRAGIIVPTGIATDDSTKAFFAGLVDEGRLVSLFDFENRDALFPGVHRSYKFALLTIGDAQAIDFSFFATQVEHLQDPRRHFRLSVDDFTLINPNTRTCPIFRSEYDAELTRKIYRRVPVLIDETKPAEDGNPWGISFSAMFHMSAHSELFHPAPGPDRVPLYEAKMIHQFDHRWATYEAGAASDEASSRDVTEAEKTDPGFAVRPRYWVDREEVESRLAAQGWTRQWLLGFRDITNATNERTVVASVVPRVGVGNSLPLVLPAAEHGASAVAILLAALTSLPLDYVARHKVGGTHLNYFIFKQLPLLAPASIDSADADFAAPRILELTYTSLDVEPWAHDLGYGGAPFQWKPERRAVLRAELDAWCARRYGLDRDELRFILDPGDVMGPDYPSETFRGLKQRELGSYGEFRTQRLVLEAWDRLFGDR